MTQARKDKLDYLQQNGGDVSMLLQKIDACKLDEPGWEYAACSELNKLTRLFWMNPYQKVLARFFGDVIIIDSSEGKNLYDYHLTTFVVINGDNESRNIGYCLHLYEDEEAYTWMFRNMRNILGTSMPETIFTDRAGGIDCGIKSTWPDAYHGICLWHLAKNLRENLLGCLHKGFPTFMQDFWTVYRKGSPVEFEAAWAKLLNDWTAAQSYLKKEIYSDKEKWAWAWVGTHFAAGTRTTGRVEVEHKVYKARNMSRRYKIRCHYILLTHPARPSTSYSMRLIIGPKNRGIKTVSKNGR